MTRAELDRLLSTVLSMAAAETSDTELARTVRLLARVAAKLEAEGAIERLTMAASERTISGMDVNTGRQEALRRGIARATRQGKAQRRLYDKGQTISGLAKELKEGRPRVSAWFADGESFRPPPLKHAEYIRDRYQIPLSWWPRVGN